MRDKILSVTKKDLVITHFRAGGPGGQHQNKTDSASRVAHPASGAVGESREHRSQPQNTKAAFRRMTETLAFKKWLGQQLADGPSPESWVEQEMNKSEHFLVEGRESGTWVPIQ